MFGQISLLLRLNVGANMLPLIFSTVKNGFGGTQNPPVYCFFSKFLGSTRTQQSSGVWQTAEY
jgi:hypothetical protein